MTVGYALFKNSTLYQPFCDDTDNWDIIKYLTKLQTDYRNLSYYDIFNYKLQDSGISFLKESMNTKVSNRKSASNLMKNGFITASANINDMDEDAKKYPIVTQTEKNVSLNSVMSNSFGFGGTNATLIFEKV